jgi:hypothetical protein
MNERSILELTIDRTACPIHPTGLHLHQPWRVATLCSPSFDLDMRYLQPSQARCPLLNRIDVTRVVQKDGWSTLQGPAKMRGIMT